MFEKWFYIYLLRSMLTKRTRYFWPGMYERLCFFARGCVFLWDVVCLCVWEVVCFFERANLKSAGALSRSPLSHRPPPFYLSQILIFNIFNPIILINLILFIPTLFILKLIFSLFCKPLIHHFQIIFHFMIFTDERILRNATKKVRCLRLFVAFLPQLLQVNPIQTKKILKKLWRASYVTDEQLFIAGICRLSIWETPL